MHFYLHWYCLPGAYQHRKPELYTTSKDTKVQTIWNVELKKCYVEMYSVCHSVNEN